MSQVAIANRRWYRVAERSAAVIALAALACFVLVSRGWITGSPVPLHSLFGLAASTSLLVGYALRPRSWGLATALIALTGGLFVLAIVSLSRGQ